MILKGLEEVNKYSLFSPSSLLVVKLISVERMDSALLLLLLAVFSGFNCSCLLSALISSQNEKEGQRLLSVSGFGFKTILFLLFKFGNISAISSYAVVLVTIVTPHVGLLRIIR
jgi:hypothetical protein